MLESFSMTWRQFRMTKVARLLLAASLIAIVVAGCGKEKKTDEQEAFSFTIYPGSRYLAPLTDLWKQAGRVLRAVVRLQQSRARCHEQPQLRETAGVLPLRRSGGRRCGHRPRDAEDGREGRCHQSGRHLPRRGDRSEAEPSARNDSAPVFRRLDVADGRPHADHDVAVMPTSRRALIAGLGLIG